MFDEIYCLEQFSPWYNRSEKAPFMSMRGIQSRGSPERRAVSLDVIVHMEPTKQSMSVLLSVEGSVQITVDVEPRVPSKMFFLRKLPP